MKAITRAKTLRRALAASFALAAFCGLAETPDYFVEYAEPNAALYVDTGIIGKSGTRVEIRVANFGGGDIVIGARHTDSVRFEPVRFWGEQSGMKYANNLYHQTVFSPYYGDWIYDHAVSSAGILTATVTDCGAGGNNGSTSHDWGTAINTETTMYIFGSHYRSDTEDKPVDQNLRRVYYCKIFLEDGNGGWTLVRDLKPCVKDGVVGFYDAATGYDALNGTIFYPQGGGSLKGGNLVYDTVATWNGGATPTAADLATAANWNCTDANGTAIASVEPGKTTLAVLPSGIVLPSGYEAPWAATKIAGTLAHPATLWGREEFSGDRKSYSNGGVRSWQWRGDGLQNYVARGEGDVSYLNQGGNKPAELQHAQFRYDGWFNVSAEQAGEWALSQAFDDYFGLCIDGNWVLSYNSFSGGQNTTWTATAGWHRFTMIAGDTWGGWGASKSVNGTSVPFTISTPNYNEGALFKFSDLQFGTGSNTITLSANADWSALGTLALCDGTVIDLNGCQLTIKDAIVDGYIGAKFVNSNSKKAVLIFTGEPNASTALKYGLIDGAGTKILLAKAGEQSATWTGAANNGNALDANNWQDSLTDEAVVPTANYAVTIVGTAVNVQIPSGSTFACKSFSIGNCTFTADCDWRGLSVMPTISGAANLNGHVLKLNHLVAVTGSAFSGGAGSVVEFVVDESATVATLSETAFIDNAANLSLSGDAKILLRKKDGGGTLTATQMLLGSALYTELVQTNGTVNLGNTVNKMGDVSGKKGTYTMKDGTLTTSGSSEFVIGANGIGTFNMTGGSATIGNWISVGRYNGGNGTFNMTGGSLTVSKTNRPMWLGGDNGTGTFNFGGTATANFKGIDIGKQNSAKGYLNIDGGTLTVSNGDGFNVGRDAAGTVVQNDGTLNVNTTFRLAWGNGNDTMTGSYTLNGGVVNVNADCYFGYGRIATYVQNGGTMNANNGVTLANQASSKTTVTLAGGVFKTKFLKKGSGTAAVTLAGGTLKAAADGNILEGIDNLVFGNGTTIDTDGHSTSITGCGYDTVPGSSFVKAGAGTLTVDAIPPVNTLVVSNGTLALSAAADNRAPLAALAHRWTFNEDDNDTITGAAPASRFGTRSISDGKVHFTGNSWGGGSLSLGTGSLGTDDATVEIWATQDAVRKNSVIFSYSNNGWGTAPTKEVCMQWTAGEDINKDALWLSNSGDKLKHSNQAAPYTLGTEYHIAMTFHDNGDGSTSIYWQKRNAATGELEKSGSGTASGWTIADLTAASSTFAIGVWKTNAAKDACASYNEVRVWKGALSEEALALSAAYGPDATVEQINAIAAKNRETASGADYRTIYLASGGTLDLGGYTLMQPVIAGAGAVQNGTLTVTEKIRLYVGDCITASGTIDLTDAKVELVDPENLTNGFYFIKPAANATLNFVGKPTAENLPTGWQISVTSNGAKVQKVGFSIYLR